MKWLVSMPEQRKRTWCLWVVCAVVLTAVTWQGLVLIRLQRENRRLAAVLTVQRSKPTPALRTEVLEELQRLRRDNEEVNRLRAEAARHRKALEELPSIESAYERIVREIETTKLKTAALTDDEFFSLLEENHRKMQCVVHMKQVLLAARVWSNEHGGDNMPTHYLAINAELPDVKLLVCPSDVSRRPAADWNSFEPLNASYEMLSPGVSETDPEIVYIRCPIHGAAGLVDGSVSRLSSEFHVGLKDGKWKILRSGP